MDFNSVFKVKKNFDLGGEDHFSLVRLYMPLIGVDGYGLFSYLHTIDSSDVCTLKSMLETLNFPNVKYLENALDKLEALSLVETHFHETKGYVIALKRPLNVDTFLSEPLLESFLRSQIGSVEVDKLHCMMNVTVKGYKNISKKFDEVYTPSDFELENYLSVLFNQKFKDKIHVKNENFDYILFKMGFDETEMDLNILEEKELKDTVLNISYTYGLTELEMKKVIMKSITVDHDLNRSILSKNAKNMYQSKNKTKQVRFVTKEADAFVSSEMDNETFLFLHRMDTSTPREVLEALSGIAPSDVELAVIQDLINNTTFSLGVINVLVLFVLKEKDNILPGYNYLYKVANSWARAGVKTTQDALNHINQTSKKQEEAKKAPVKGNYQKNKKVAKKPDWYDEYEEQLKQAVQENTTDGGVNQDETNQIFEEAKEIFK